MRPYPCFGDEDVKWQPHVSQLYFGHLQDTQKLYRKKGRVDRLSFRPSVRPSARTHAPCSKIQVLFSVYLFHLMLLQVSLFDVCTVYNIENIILHSRVWGQSYFKQITIQIAAIVPNTNVIIMLYLRSPCPTYLGACSSWLFILL